MDETQTSALVLLSGGMDSTTLLHYVVKKLERNAVHALSFDYGQRHLKELTFARRQCESLGVSVHRVVDVSFLGEVFKGATALVEGVAVPDLKDLHPSDLEQPPTYVPNRNMILLSIAAAYAECRAIRDVFYGAQALDEYGYWDCTGDFVGRMNRVLSLNRGETVIIHAPFVRMRKADTLRMGMKLGVDYALTWSCYRGGEKACGTCPTCVERLKAFRELGIEDPLDYVTR